MSGIFPDISYETNRIIIYPNPFIQRVINNFETLNHETYTLLIYKAQVRLFRKILGVQKSIEIQGASYSRGMYFFCLGNNNGVVGKGKSMKL
ncbi:MAG: T9SS type A sorting domain-containing protein [Bacteroidales bacterium]|nr:T9SS type A sorting domain-containing protein [Bacteroidales bacterium]